MLGRLTFEGKTAANNNERVSRLQNDDFYSK